MATELSMRPVSQHYSRQRRKRVALIAVSAVILLVCFLADIASGPGNLSVAEVFSTLMPATSESANLAGSNAANHAFIVWDIRLPTALTALLIGAMLAAAGAQMQTILNNPLADPFTLGISSAASFGAALPVVFDIKIWSGGIALESSVSAFIFAMLTTLLLYLFTRLKDASSETMVLIGIALLFTFNALLSIVQYSATDTQLSQIVFWMMGSLGRSNWQSVIVCAVVFASLLPLFAIRAWSMTSMRMGEEKAESLGVNVGRLRIEMLVAVSLLTATAVSFVGTVGFVGLVAPHIARILVGEDQRLFLPAAIICGALLMSLTSILSKTISPGVVYPIGMITSLIGIPFFISLILKAQNRSWS